VNSGDYGVKAPPTAIAANGTRSGFFGLAHSQAAQHYLRNWIGSRQFRDHFVPLEAEDVEKGGARRRSTPPSQPNVLDFAPSSEFSLSS
jgi:hypothetical protein